MKNHIDTKRKAEIIQQAYKLRAKGISIKEICLTYNLEINTMQKWLRTYKLYLRGDEMQENCISRCIPYFENGTLDIFENMDKEYEKDIQNCIKKEKKAPRNEVLSVRVSKHMREKIQRQSIQDNLPMSEMIAKILTKAISEKQEKKENKRKKITILWGLITIN